MRTEIEIMIPYIETYENGDKILRIEKLTFNDENEMKQFFIKDEFEQVAFEGNTVYHDLIESDARCRIYYPTYGAREGKLKDLIGRV